MAGGNPSNDFSRSLNPPIPLGPDSLERWWRKSTLQRRSTMSPGKRPSARLLALCPGYALQQRPPAQHDDPDRIATLALQGIREDEWRLQRIRPFDWYSVEFKRQAQRELQAKYWSVWSLQGRSERLAGRPQKEAELQ